MAQKVLTEESVRRVVREEAGPEFTNIRTEFKIIDQRFNAIEKRFDQVFEFLNKAMKQLRDIRDDHLVLHRQVSDHNDRLGTLDTIS